MRGIKTLIIWLLIGLFLEACRGSTISTSTLADMPTPTLTPRSGLQVPTRGGRWQVTVEAARTETQLTVGFIYPNTEIHKPKPGYTFLIVDINFRNLDPIQKTGVPSEAITIIGADGEISTVAGVGYTSGENFICVDCSGILRPRPQHLAFVIKEKSIDQPWQLQFPDLLPIPFSLDGEPEHGFVTDIGNKPGVLPAECQAVAALPSDRIGPITYEFWTETGLTLANMANNGSDGAELCAGVAYVDIQQTADGAVLLLVGPHQGWPDLYLIEADGTVISLVKNSPSIQASFGPTGRNVLFTATKLGETKEGLYVFERDTASMTMVKEEEWVNFRFLANNRLILSTPHTVLIGDVDGTNLEQLDLPDNVYAHNIAYDGEHIVYANFDDNFKRHLLVADLDGSNSQKLVTTEGIVWGELAPDGRSILMSTSQEQASGVEEQRYLVKLRNLATAENRTLIEDLVNPEFRFSTDSRWALVFDSVESDDVNVETKSTLHIVSLSDGGLGKIDNVINAVFSPDNTQLAYTVRAADSSSEIYALSLESGAAQLLGYGVINDWLPIQTMESGRGVGNQISMESPSFLAGIALIIVAGFVIIGGVMWWRSRKPVLPEQFVAQHPLSPRTETLSCPACQTPFPPDARFCMSCGKPLEQTTRLSAASAAQSSLPSTTLNREEVISTASPRIHEQVAISEASITESERKKIEESSGDELSGKNTLDITMTDEPGGSVDNYDQIVRSLEKIGEQETPGRNERVEGETISESRDRRTQEPKVRHRWVQKQNSWLRWSLKTGGILALIIPIITINGYLYDVAQFKASLTPTETLVIDWDLVPAILLKMGLFNLIGFPILFFLATAISFGAARMLEGTGNFWPHSFETALAYLKVVLVGIVVFAFMVISPAAGCLGLGILYIFLKLMSGAISKVHNISPNRGFIAMLPLIFIPVGLGIFLLLGPVIVDVYSNIIQGLRTPVP